MSPGSKSMVCGFSSAISAHSIGCRPRWASVLHRSLTKSAYSSSRLAPGESCTDRPRPKSKVSSPPILKDRERNSGAYSSIRREAKSCDLGLAAFSVWCSIRSMKLNGRSASSGNSPSPRCSRVRRFIYMCPKVAKDGTSSMPWCAQYSSRNMMSSAVSGSVPRHASLSSPKAKACSTYSWNWLYLYNASWSMNQVRNAIVGTRPRVTSRL